MDTDILNIKCVSYATLETQFMKTFSNTEAELKKGLLIKKSMYFPVKSARQGKTLHSLKQESKTKQWETNSKLHLLQMVEGAKIK